MHQHFIDNEDQNEDMFDMASGNTVCDVKHYYYPWYYYSESKAPRLCREKLSFTWSETNLSLVNGLRRVILSEIPIKVLGKFEFHNLINPNIAQSIHPFEFSKLVPVMHNEQLTLALQMIPISQEFESVAVCLGYKCVEGKLTIEEGYCNNTNIIEDITTQHLDIYQLAEDGRVVDKIKNDVFFPRRVLITKLKKDQRLGFRCAVIVGTGKQNAMFTPVCSVSYSYDDCDADNEMVDTAVSAYRKEYERNPNVDKRPTSFSFSIHSLPYYSPEQILFMGLDTIKSIMSSLLGKFNQMVEKHMDGKDPNGIFTIDRKQVGSLELYQSSFSFMLKRDKKIISLHDDMYNPDGGESSANLHEITYGHTVGNLLQHYLCRDSTVVFAAFVNDHPKVEQLRCRVVLRGTPSIHEFLQTISMAIGYVVQDCESLRRNASMSIIPPLFPSKQ